MDWKSLFHRRQSEAELDEEFAFHLEARTQENIARGLTPVEAAREARRAMDGIDRHKEACRDARGWSEQADRLWRTVRHAGRRLAISPGFTFVAVATLALGIGAATAIFSLVNGILLKPLPFREPGRLVTITQNVSAGKAYTGLPVSAAHAEEWRKRARSIESISLFTGDRRYLPGQGGGLPEAVFSVNTSADFFTMLGASPALGRGFAAGEDSAGHNMVIVLSHEFWRDRYGSDPKIIGQRMHLTNGESLEVIGVMPAGFTFLKGNDLNLQFNLPARCDYWRPLALDPGQFNPVSEFNNIAVARVRAGTGVRAAAAELTALSRGLVKAAGSPLEISVDVVAVPDAIWGGVSRPLQLLAGAVGVVLLICCLNVSNLMLARLLARRHEYAIRASLGASRGSLMFEMLAEGALIALAGGAIGLAAAAWLMEMLPRLATIPLPSVADLAFDWRVASFALVACAAATLLASAVPAWRFSQADPQDAIRSSGAGRSVTGSRAAHRLRNAMVAAEVGLCLVLLVAAGLLVRSFDQLSRVDRGFNAEQALVFDAVMPVERYRTPEQFLTGWRALIERLRQVPGVTAVGAVNRLPMASERAINGVLAEGEAPRPMFQQPMANYRGATPGYFAAAGIPVRAGTVFTEDEGDRHAVLVSENLAKRLWPGQNPIGRRFRRNGQGEWLTVRGVVADVKQASLEAAAPLMVYLREVGSSGLNVVVRTAMAPEPFARILRQQIPQVDAGINIHGIQPLAEMVSATTARRRLQTVLLSAFAALAALLAGLGIWGVVAHTVGQRRNEIGVRIALGAKPGSVVALVMRQGLRPVMLGAAGGALAAVAMARALQSFLFGIGSLDPLAYGAAAAMLALVAAVACAAPARRAATLDPVQALRVE